MAEIDAAAASLQPGTYTREPVKSAFGFHVLKLEERRTRPAPPFEALAGQIRASLEQAATQAIMGELRSGAAVEKLVPDVAPPAADDGHDHGSE
jgi:peptidyl-prolyl cis-trans isomerase C